MDALKQLRIGNRLAIAFAIVLALMLVVSIVGVRGIYRVAAGLETVYKDRTVPLAQLGELNNLTTRNRLVIVEMLRAPGLGEGGFLVVDTEGGSQMPLPCRTLGDERGIDPARQEQPDGHVAPEREADGVVDALREPIECA